MWCSCQCRYQKGRKGIHHGSPIYIILHILADLESEFRKSYLRKSNIDDALTSESYYTSIKFAGNLKSEFKTTFRFLNGLEEDKHGSLICNLKRPSGDQHKMKQNYIHCPVRRQEVVLSKVNQIKDSAQLIKGTIVANLVDNIVDQSQTGTIVKCASLFNFNNPIDLETQTEHLKELHAIYCISYKHTVPKMKMMNLMLRGILQLLRFSINLKLTAHKNKLLKSYGQFGQ